MSQLERLYRLRLCPACGFQLDFRPWDKSGPSDEICPCCGIQFGYDDAGARNFSELHAIYALWRDKWQAGGSRWWSKSAIPPGFDPALQLGRLQAASVRDTDPRPFQQQVIDFIETMKSTLPQDDYLNAEDLAQNGEEGVALEMVCDQLQQNQIRIPRAIFNEMKRLADAMELDPFEPRWQMLETLVSE